MEIEAFGEIFVLRMRKTKSVLHPSSSVHFSSHDEVTSLPHVPRDCEWVAEVLSHGGWAVFSTCGPDRSVVRGFNSHFSAYFRELDEIKVLTLSKYPIILKNL